MSMAGAGRPELWGGEAAAPAGGQSEPFWRSLFYFNAYRLLVALLLLMSVAIWGSNLWFGSRDLTLFVVANVGYVMFGVGCFVLISSRRRFNLQLTAQVAADVVFIVLLLAVLAAAGLISRGRLTLFHAALASIAVLLEHTYDVLRTDAAVTLYLQTGLLSIGFFATAWVAHVLARYAVASEQLAAQREIDLADMAELNRLVIQDMDDGVLVVDAAGTVRSHNARAEALLGLGPETRDGAALARCAPALAERFAAWSPAPPAGPDVFTIAIGMRPVGARFVPVGRHSNLGAVIFLEDLTRVQAQARQMKLASLGRLTANIAHEIRNPLSAISHATELLQEEPGQGDTAARLLAIIRENTLRLDRMVEDVLKLNRRDSAHREVFALEEFLPVFAEQFCGIEHVDPATVSLEISARARVRFDRSHLNQIMWNLCRNALRHCRGAHGSIRVRVAPAASGARVRLCVTDDGPGVPPEFRAHLFEPFFTTVATGTGLGLYIAREVCEANDAALEYVETDSGAQFCVTCRTVEG